ncbi:MAG: hypothetical protein ABIG60_03665 [Patescibacteria group bacterium]
MVIYKIGKNNKGVALIITILLMSLLLFLSLYFLNFTITEKRISQSQAWGAKTYYLAEAGVHEMVWRLKNNEAYKTNFETIPNWTTNFTRVDPFGSGSGSYTVTITNSSLAHGLIESVGTIDIGGKTSQRIIKTEVYRAMGEGGVELGDNCGYADGNIDISFSLVNFYNGSAHSNNTFTINGLSLVNIDTDLNAVGNFIKSWLSNVNVGGTIHAANEPYPPAAEEINMPAVDFDSEDPNSYKNIADVVYSEDDFDDLMWANQNLTLNDPITYVTGDIEMRGGQQITVNGLLVSERDIEIGKSYCWNARCGRSSLTINHTIGEPSGILAKRKVYFKLWAGEMDLNGVVYASDQLNILSFPFGFSFNANGGLISRKLTITSVWQPINITRNEEILNSTLGVAEFSPVITVEHWEEEY